MAIPSPAETSAPTSAPSSRWPLAVAAVGTVVWLAVATRYGWHGDELVMVDLGDRLDIGYVGRPPLVPALARLITMVCGDSLFALRAVAALAGGLTVIVSARTAAALGGRWFAQTLTAFVVLSCGFVQGVFHVFGPAAAGVLASVLVLDAVVRLVVGQDLTKWQLAGVVAGLGLWASFTVGVVAIAFVLAVALSPLRHMLRSSKAMFALAPVLSAFAAMGAGGTHDDGFGQVGSLSLGERLERTPQLLADTARFAGPAALALVIVGAVALRRRTGRDGDVLILLAAFAIAVCAVAGVSANATLPTLFPLIAAGAIAVESTVANPLARRAALAGVGLCAVVTAFAVLPLLSAERAGDTEVAGAALIDANPTLAATYGWSDELTTIEAVVGQLTPQERAQTVIYAESAAVAGAIDRLSATLPPAYSAEGERYLWGPPPEVLAPAVLIGEFDRGLVTGFDRCEISSLLTTPLQVDNGRRDTKIYLCRDQTTPWSTLWDQLGD